MPSERPLVIVSKSEPEDATAKLSVYGLNAIAGEVGSDYVWYPHGNTFAIERKTTANLLQSLKDRQLVEQAQRGTKQFSRYFLLIEGGMRRAASGRLEFHYPRHPQANSEGWVTSGWQYEAIDGMLFDLGLLGVQIVTCDLFDYPRKIAQVVMATSSEVRNFLRERQRPDLPIAAQMGGELYSDAIWALCALPGVGPEVAQALLTEYGTLSKAIRAAAEEPEIVQHTGTPLADVRINGKKLGTKRAARIREAVTQKFN